MVEAVKYVAPKLLQRGIGLGGMGEGDGVAGWGSFGGFCVAKLMRSKVVNEGLVPAIV